MKQKLVSEEAGRIICKFYNWMINFRTNISEQQLKMSGTYYAQKYGNSSIL